MNKNTNLPVRTEFYQQLPTPKGSTALRNLLKIIFRQRNYILGFFLAVIIPVIAFTIITPNIYQSEAKIFIQMGRENMSVDPSVVGPTSSVRTDRESELNSEVSVIKSRILAELAVSQVGAQTVLGISTDEKSDTKEELSSGLFVKLGLKSPVPIKEIAIKELMSSLNAEAENNSHIIQLNYQAQSPELAKSLLDVLIELYRDRHIEMHQAQAPLQFIEKNADELMAALKQKEANLKSFQEQNSISSLDAQKRESLEQVSLLQKEVDQVVSLTGASQAKIQSIRESLIGRSPSRELNRVVGRPNRAVEAIKERLFELRAQEADLSAHYHDTDRGLIDLREKIRLAEKQLSNESETLTEVTQGVDTNYQSLQLSLANEKAQLQALNARKAILDEQISQRKGELLNLSSHESQLLSLQREVDIASTEYQRYRENLQRAKIYADLDSGRISNVSVVQPPSFSPVPIKPRKTLCLLLGVLIGATGGLMLAFMREYFDSSIKASDDVEEKLGLPVLASISREEFEACI